MQNFFEFEGKNAEAAIDNACKTINVSRDCLEIEIIEPGSAGIFGLVGGRNAKIRVRVLNENDFAEESLKTAASSAEDYDDENDFLEEELSDEVHQLSPDDMENAMQMAQESLKKIIELISVENVNINGSVKDGSIYLDIIGDTSGLLIGRKGRTLYALQFIVNKMVNKHFKAHVQVVLDLENYRSRRQEHLTKMAFDLGAKAKRFKKPMTTHLLNPHDRKIVHVALRDDLHLSTKSRGEGILKKVIIIPKNISGKKHSS